MFYQYKCEGDPHFVPAARYIMGDVIDIVKKIQSLGGCPDDLAWLQCRDLDSREPANANSPLSCS